METYTIAGKVFILGEYAVLAGLPALVATVGPRFSMDVLQKEESDVFHPNSPIEKLNSWAKEFGLPALSFRFQDPHREAGGFGASTAQFATAYLAYVRRMESQEPRRWTRAWKLYRELLRQGASTQSVLASGADLVAQWQGGIVFFDPTDEHCLDVWPLFDWSNLLVFSATSQQGRKVPTHGHLSELVSKGFPGSYGKLMASLETILCKGIEAVQENDAFSLGQAMNHYADALFQEQLELEATHKDRLELLKLPGVLGVKGTGALQSDGILILMKANADHAPIIEFAEKRGLRCIADGLTCQMGISGEIEK